MRAKRYKAGAAAFGALAIVATWFAIIPPAQAAPGPRFGENFLLPPQSPGRGRDVPGLAVDPSDPNHIVEAEIDPINLQCDYNVSFDGGRTWKGGHLDVRRGTENPAFGPTACDWNFDAGGYAHFNTGIVFGSGQNVYVTFSAHRGAFNRLDTSPPTEGGAGDESMVARSTDGGRTFEPAVVAIPGATTPQPVSIRPQIAVQRGAGIGGQDRLYVNAWQLRVTVAGGGPRRMLVARSDDGGTTWNTPDVASALNVRSGADATSAETPDEIVRELSQPVVAPDGAVYAAYRNADRFAGTTCPPNPVIRTQCIVFAKSTDQGATWTQTSTGIPLSGATQPKIAIDPADPDPATPGNPGTLYVAFNRTPGADTDINLQRSTDGGQTWSNPPVRVNDDPPGTVQSYPQVSVGPGGRVDVTWFDRRHAYPGTGTRMGDPYYARSSNGGATASSFSPNRRVTDRTINLDTGIEPSLGSYSFYGPVSQPLPDGSVLSAWMDSRQGDVDNGFQDIFVSRLDGGAGGVGSSAITTASPPGLSVRLSRLAYPGGTEGVGPRGGEPFTRLVVANEGDVAGALAGSVLARSRFGSLLLSPAGGLPGAVKAEAARMEPEGAYVIGDGASLSSAVASDVRETTRAGENVTRVASPSNVRTVDRPAETARRVAELIAPLPPPFEVVIANPKTPEAASAAALAAALKLPILFVDERTVLPPPTLSAISSLGVKKALIVGGTTSVNAGVAGALATALGDPANVRRVGGADQYATSEAVLTEARTRGLPSNVVYVADGARSVDAAVLGAAVARLGGLMLLTPSGSTATAESRLTALGVDAAVDRLVAAVGTGGTDPAAPAAPTPTTPTTPTVTPPPPGLIPIVPPAARDTTAPLVALSGKTAQSIKLGYLSVTAQANEAVALSATGSVARPSLRATSRASAAARAEKARTYRLRSTKAKAKAGQKVTLRLRLTKKTIKAVKQGLGRGRRSTAKITVVAVDAAGNKRTVKRQIRIIK